MADITAVILTRNEEKNIERCIASVKDLVCRIVVVDSGSTDRTVELAQAAGAEIRTHIPFVHYAAQFNWALDNIDIQTKWVFRLDADEQVTEQLAAEIERKCAEHAEDQVNGFLMKFKIFFLGRFLKHGGAYPFIKVALFKYGKGRFENRAMGEHIVLTDGTFLMLDQDCLHYDFKSLSAFVEKHNNYATREVMDRFDAQRLSGAKLYDDAEKTKKYRDGLYYRLPVFFRARLFYWFNYYLRLGFLDGTPGRIYAFLQSYWYRYLVDAKLYEAEHTENRN